MLFPAGITALNPMTIPLLNTILLLSSGATVTYAHHALIEGNRRAAIVGTGLTIVLAIVFLGLQGFECMDVLPISYACYFIVSVLMPVALIVDGEK